MCPKRQARMDVGALSGASTASGASSARSSARSAASDPGTSISRVHASAVSQLLPVQEDENDDWTYDATWWHEDGDWRAEREGWSYDAGWAADAWHDDESENFCVYALRRAADDVEESLIDSGSQSTACRKYFAPHYSIDDTEKARLWDIQDQEIKSYGKRL